MTRVFYREPEHLLFAANSRVRDLSPDLSGTYIINRYAEGKSKGPGALYLLDFGFLISAVWPRLVTPSNISFPRFDLLLIFFAASA